jgi:Family of unknown function (DUF6130)
MTMLIKPLAVVAAGTVLTTIAFAQSARDIRGASPYIATVREPAPKLLVDPPLPEGLAQGVFWAGLSPKKGFFSPVALSSVYHDSTFHTPSSLWSPSRRGLATR